MTGYEVKIVDSSMELSARDKISLKNFDNAIALDEAVNDENPRLLIEFDNYAVAQVHNEKSDNKDYKKYIIIAKDGTRYTTGSEPFFTSFMEIYEEMQDDGEDFSVIVYKKESNNYKGKSFLTCTIA